MHIDLAYSATGHANGQPGLRNRVAPRGTQGLRHPTRALSPWRSAGRVPDSFAAGGSRAT